MQRTAIRFSIAICSALSFACSDGGSGTDSNAIATNSTATTSAVSPVFKIDRDGRPGRRSRDHDHRTRDRRGRGDRSDRDHRHHHHDDHRRHAQEVGVRTIDGTGNNESSPEWGATGATLVRVAPARYGDGVSSLAGADRPSPRSVSNAVSDQPALIENPLGTSDYLWQWGQFVDHDIDLTDGVDPPEPTPIPVPTGDPFFDPTATGTETIAFNRSIYDATTGTDPSNPRQQSNEITSYIDASNVYGSDLERAHALRTLDGTGRLTTSDGDLLPFNVLGLPNAGGNGPELFLAGDVRANEQAALAAMHTLFVREHNRLVERYAVEHPAWDGEELYQKAREIVAAQMQVITYREFLPALLGPNALPAYRGYVPGVDATIGNSFSTAAYRFGHSALSAVLLRLDRRGEEIDAGHLPLRDAFFSPVALIDEGGIEPLLRGLAAQAHQRIDLQVVDDIRNFLFGPPGAGGFDLASLNIQRGRDHGLPSFNEMREALGFARARSFADMTRDADTESRLGAVYKDADDVDLWVGCLAESALPGSHLGELATKVLVDQFVALRDGDRFWYRRALTRSEIDEVEATRLSDIIRRNTEIGSELQADVFYAP